MISSYMVFQTRTLKLSKIKVPSIVDNALPSVNHQNDGSITRRMHHHHCILHVFQMMHIFNKLIWFYHWNELSFATSFFQQTCIFSNRKLLHAISITFNLIPGYSILHIRPANKVIFTYNTSTHPKSRTLKNFVWDKNTH